MSKLSKKREEKIMSDIVATLFQRSPEPLFTSQISEIEGRDEEFIKRLLVDLKKKGLVAEVVKNKEGVDYTRRRRWRLSNEAYEAYKKHQIKF